MINPVPATHQDCLLAEHFLKLRGWTPSALGWTDTALLTIAHMAGWQVSVVLDDFGLWRVSVIRSPGVRETCRHHDRTTAVLVAVASMVAAFPPDASQP